MNQLSIPRNILAIIEQTLGGNVAALYQDLGIWVSLFLGFELCRTVWQITHGAPPQGLLAELIMRASLWLFVLYNFDYLATGTIEYLGWLAQKLTGTYDQGLGFLDPGAWYQIADEAVKPLERMADAATGLSNIVLGIKIAAYHLAFYAAFLVIAAKIFILQLEALVASHIAIIVLPTLLTRRMAWIGEGAVSLLVNQAMHLAVTVAISGLTYGSMRTIAPQLLAPPLTTRNILTAIGVMWALAILVLFSRRIASAITSGIPQLNTAAAIQAAAAFAAPFLGAGYLAVGGASAVAGGGALLGREALAVAQGVRAASGGAQAMRGAAMAARQSGLGARLGIFAMGEGRRQGALTAAGTQAQLSLRHFADYRRLAFGGQDASHLGSRLH